MRAMIKVISLGFQGKSRKFQVREIGPEGILKLQDGTRKIYTVTNQAKRWECNCGHSDCLHIQRAKGEFFADIKKPRAKESTAMSLLTREQQAATFEADD